MGAVAVGQGHNKGRGRGTKHRLIRTGSVAFHNLLYPGPIAFDQVQTVEDIGNHHVPGLGGTTLNVLECQSLDPVSYTHLLSKRKALDLNEIVQGRFPADFAGEPVPFSVADLQAVMLTGAVGASAHMDDVRDVIEARADTVIRAEKEKGQREER